MSFIHVRARHQQRAAQFLQKVAALQNDPWHDVKQSVNDVDYEDMARQQQDLARKISSLQEAQIKQHQENRQLLDMIRTIIKEQNEYRQTVAAQLHADLRSRARAQREALREAARIKEKQLIMTRIEEIVCGQKEVERRLDQHILEDARQQPSLVSTATQKVLQISRSLIAMLSRWDTRMSQASDRHAQFVKTTGSKVADALVVGSFMGWIHFVAPIVRWAFTPPGSNSAEVLGLFVDTMSLPLLIAIGPGFKGAYRFSKRNSTWKGLIKAYRRRFLSTSRSVQGPRKQTAFRDLVDNHPDLLDKPFPMATVLNDLRNLQALRGPTAGREYRVAERRLFRVQHESEAGSGETLTVRQVTELLEPDDSVGWTVISQRLLQNRVDAIDRLSEQDRARMLFQRVYGVGAVKADKFVQAGYLTLAQLRDAPLEKAQRIGLEHMDDIDCLIPRSESEQWRDVLLDLFRSIDPKLGAELLGSFRRGDYFSSDLDWVLYHPSVVDMHIPRPDGSDRRILNPEAASLLKSIIEELRTRNLLVDEPLAHGPLAMKGLVRLPGAGAKARRIDLNFAPYTRRAFYTLAKTGDADLMVHLRSQAKKKGWALNEYGIGSHNQNGSAWTENLLDATEERQIFEFLGVPYLEPEERAFSIYAKRLNIRRS